MKVLSQKKKKIYYKRDQDIRMEQDNNIDKNFYELSLLSNRKK